MINSPGQIFKDEIGQIINLEKERSIDVIITRLRKIEDNPKTKVSSNYKRGRLCPLGW